ncbi:MAG TPA: aminopeptidase P N-terminal domain-containing protein [Longimicrobiales bacterium]|nr:aminopeptidase P N-terminal domain-containing protein [Longimicrobiales bacterium]
MTRFAFVIAAAWTLTAGAERLAGQVSNAVPGIPESEYVGRRAEVAERVGDGVVLAFGGRSPVDDLGRFRQTPSFRWLTGYTRPNAVLLMVVRQGEPRATLLFEPAIDPRMYLYDGFPADSAELFARTGLALRPLDALQPTVDSLSEELPLLVVSDVYSRDYLAADSLTRGRAFSSRLRNPESGIPNPRIRSLDPLLDSLRLTKSDAEVALLREAIHITVDALETALRVIEPGMNEGELEAVIEYSFRVLGADGAGFGSIVGSGPNSTSYHYRANDRDMRAGDVVVMDVGAIVDGYTADVTRTVPVDGTFSDEQAAIYEIVLAAQAAAVREIRPGAAVATGHDAMRRVIAAGLARLGLTQSLDARFDPPWASAEACERRPLVCTQAYLYMAHGLGHGIGLEVHDVGGHSYSFSGRFAAGEVLTVEPGIYVSETLLDMLPDTERNRAFIAAVRDTVRRYADIGVRIEDDYLVTAEGVEWLSPAPRNIQDIESMMARPPSLPMP